MFALIFCSRDNDIPISNIKKWSNSNFRCYNNCIFWEGSVELSSNPVLVAVSGTLIVVGNYGSADFIY